MKKQSKSANIALAAILGAISLICVYAAAVLPSGSWGIVAVAGLFPAAVVISAGVKAGILCWGGVSILAFLLVPGKLCALLYTVLFGLYPLVKAFIERIGRRVIEYILKLVFFNASFSAVYLIMTAAVLDSLPEMFELRWLLYLVGNVVFLIYDFGFSRLIVFYIARIKRVVK